MLDDGVFDNAKEDKSPTLTGDIKTGGARSGRKAEVE